jgi:hypothetical protein
MRKRRAKSVWTKPAHWPNSINPLWMRTLTWKTSDES